VKGRMPWASNATFLVELALPGATILAVYKPERGERPLWDFPRGLYKRELAAWHLSEAFGWGLVPLTIERDGQLVWQGSAFDTDLDALRLRDGDQIVVGGNRPGAGSDNLRIAALLVSIAGGLYGLSRAFHH